MSSRCFSSSVFFVVVVVVGMVTRGVVGEFADD